MRKILLIFAFLLPVVLLISIIVWYFAIYQKPTETFPSAKPTPGVGFGSLKPYASLCVKFQKTQSKNSCEKAIELALDDSPGKIREIVIESVRLYIPTTSGLREKRPVKMWLINILLTKPFFDDKFNKQINALQIGIPLDEDNLIYKKPIQ